MEADKAAFPVLLANGDPVGGGDLDGGRHWAQWNDPYPKPCYLFAIVAGDLRVNSDSFTIMSGRKLQLGIWVREYDLPRTSHAMTALNNSMAWDETTFGRVYDLTVFILDTVSDFNLVAMVTKGFNFLKH